jgi:Ni,Fe-hydrogenase maturation factor
LKDLPDAAFLLGNLPDIHLVAISIKDFQEMGIGLTTEVEQAIPAAIEKVKDLVKSLSD